jgi:hypothetical protein
MATTKRIDWEEHRKGDVTLDWMLKSDIPPTRENYIFHAYAGKPPKPWTHEHEAELPEPLQDGSKVGE